VIDHTHSVAHIRNHTHQLTSASINTHKKSLSAAPVSLSDLCLGVMAGIACPYCTYLNPPSKVKCGMCLRVLRKRERPENTTKSKQTKTSPRNTKHTSSQSATSSPAVSTQKTDTAASQSQRQPSGGSECGTDDATSTASQGPHPTQQREQEQAQASSRAIQSSKRGPSGSPSAPPSSTASSALVATMFETASGKKVTVQRESIEKAKAAFASLDTADDEPPGTVPTLFQTAAGTAVRVSEASLRRARERLENAEQEPGKGEERPSFTSAAASTPAVDATTTTSENTAARRSAAPAPTFASSNRPSSAVSALSAGRRRGFVPPQQRLAVDPATRPRVAASTSSSSAIAAGTVFARPQSTRLEPLRFMSDPGDSPVITPAPSFAAIMSEEFCFTAKECGTTLSLLLGVRETQTVRVAHWHACLLKLGASGKHCTVEWCRHALLSAMFRMSCASCTTSTSASVFSATSVLLCLMQAYNTEMVDGERPTLRKMTEGDIPSASLVVLYLSSLREERSTPHMRVVTLSDGIYHVKTTCDVPLSNLLREGVLRPGQKLAVCGAKSLLHTQCSPPECDPQVAFAINYNCVRAVSPLVPLGVCHGEPPPVPLSLVHPLGGLVPAIEGVVTRVLPPFYMTQERESVAAAEDGSRPSRDRLIRAVRSSHAQLQACDRLRRTLEKTGELMAAEETKQISKVTSLLIVKDGAEALVQQWETVEERSLLCEEDGSMTLPAEGSWVTLYAVNPARSRTAAAPFTHAKLFFSARKLHFVPSKRPLQHLRQLWDTTAKKASTVCVGDVVDVCGLFMGHHMNDKGTFVLLLLQDDLYVVLQIPTPSVGRVLTFPFPTSEKTPLLLLNCTFLTTEDSVAGSDCSRLFASEYTVMLQRSMQSNFKEALARADELKTIVEIAPQKYVARQAEIFRCLDEGEAATNGSSSNGNSGNGSFSGGGGTSSYVRQAALAMAEMPPDVSGGESVGSPTATLGTVPNGRGAFSLAAPPSSREGRLPYYLRQSTALHGGGSGSGFSAATAGRPLKGVYIPPSTPYSNTLPKSSLSESAAPARATPQSCIGGVRKVGSDVSSCPHYGNISDLMFVYDPRLSRRAWHPLEDPLSGDPCASPQLHPNVRQASDEFKYVQLCWTVSADSADDLTSRVEEPRVLHELMEAVCPLKELCSLIADERHIDVSLQRTELLSRWRKEGPATVWWRFFVQSRLLSSASELDCRDTAFLWWLPSEWAETMKTVSNKLRLAFFFFSLRGDALRHARLISDNCDVRELPHD
jgi:hypothetical protein